MPTVVTFVSFINNFLLILLPNKIKKHHITIEKCSDEMKLYFDAFVCVLVFLYAHYLIEDVDLGMTLERHEGKKSASLHHISCSSAETSKWNTCCLQQLFSSFKTSPHSRMFHSPTANQAHFSHERQIVV